MDNELINDAFVKAASRLSWIGSGAITGATLGLLKGIRDAEGKNTNATIGGDTTDDGNVTIYERITDPTTIKDTALGGLIGAGLGATGGMLTPRVVAYAQGLKGRRVSESIRGIANDLIPVVKDDKDFLLGLVNNVPNTKGIGDQVYSATRKHVKDFTGPIDLFKTLSGRNRDVAKDSALPVAYSLNNLATFIHKKLPDLEANAKLQGIPFRDVIQRLTSSIDNNASLIKKTFNPKNLK